MNNTRFTGEPTPSEKRAALAGLLRAQASRTQVRQLPSPGQRALWFVHQTDKENPAYNTAFAARILSQLDLAELRLVFQTLVDRHPALRAIFSATRGELMQIVQGGSAVDFAQVDASSWSAAELTERVKKSYQLPFELERGPLFRARLFTCGADAHVLLLTFHHIICDAWSIWRLLGEFRQLYAAARGRRAALLPPPSATYAEYVEWQRKLLEGPEGKALLDYWMAELAGELPILNLERLGFETAHPAARAATFYFTLPPELFSGLRTVAKGEGVTLFTLLLAAFQVLLHRYTGQEDIIIGSPTSGRTRPEFAEVIGYFVNPVPIRSRLTGRPTFRAFLNQVRQTVLRALAHADLPFPLLVEKLQPPRDPKHSPVFQALFVFQKPQEATGLTDLLVPNTAGRRVTWDRLEVEPFPLDQMEGQFDLTLEIVEGSGCALKYRTALFDQAAMERMSGHFRQLLAAIIKDPAQRVSDLSLLDAAETREVLVAWNDTDAAPREDHCLHHIIEEQCARTPDALCLEFEGRQMSYGELNTQANRIAHLLQGLGAGPEVLVGICLERSLEMVTGLLGILKSGSGFVPLDPSLPEKRLAFAVRDSAVKAVLTQRSFAQSLMAAGVRCICLDEPLPTPMDGANPVTEVRPENVAYMIYTSGSTGEPKGALNTHLGICNRLLWMQDQYRLTPVDRVVQKTPFSFDVSVWEFFWPLMTGASLIIAKPGGHRDREYLVDLIVTRQITTIHFVPSMLESFLEARGVEKCDSLRNVFCSGEALTRPLQDRFFERSSAQLHNLYGPTEAAVDVTFWRCERACPRRQVPIGRPISRTQIYILDLNLTPVPVGIAGELFIGGDGLARGYWNRPGLTAERFVPNPFGAPGTRLYRTGDAARWSADGVIEYLHRLDQQVKVRGFRVELEEIEAHLRQHPGVREAIVLAVPQTPTGLRLAGYVIPQTGAHLSSSDLRRFLSLSLPEYMVPAKFAVLAAFPLSPSGKIDRRALSSIEANSEPRAECVPPRNEIEQGLVEVWRAVLGIKTVGIHDNFFELGGHSLRLAQVQALIQERWQRTLTMAELFEFPTVNALAERLSAAPGAPAPPESKSARPQPRSAEAALLLEQRRKKLLEHQAR